MDPDTKFALALALWVAALLLLAWVVDQMRPRKPREVVIIETAPPLRIGQVWRVVPSGDPWAPPPRAVQIADLRDGWVRYRSEGTEWFSSLRESTFRSIYTLIEEAPDVQ